MMTYPIITGIAIGRIGCFLSGTNDGTHGIPSGLIWAVDFGDGIRRHPVQIYEILFLVFLFLFLKYLDSRFSFRENVSEKGQLSSEAGTFSLSSVFLESGILKNGMKFRIFLFSYLLFRFFSEFIKPVSAFAFGISFIQISCLSGILYFIWKTASEQRKNEFSA